MLYVFDLDGTLVETYGTAILPLVAEKLALLRDQGHDLAVATNQAGLAWGLMTQDSKYPDVPGMASRFEQIARQLPALAAVPWFVSVYDSQVRLSSRHFAALAQGLVDASAMLEVYASPDPNWRKPQPGMLLAAARYHQVQPDRLFYVGDFETDAEAAANAGTGFSWAEDFFKGGSSGLDGSA